MSDFKFNAFEIKRQAHAVSRSNAGFNPFGHIWNNQDRPQTWGGEAQRRTSENDDVETSLQTASTGAQGASGHSTDRRTTKDNRADLTGLDQILTIEPERVDSSDNTAFTSPGPGSDFAPIEAATQMRNRRRLEEQVESSHPGIADEPKKKEVHRFFRSVQPKKPFTVANQILRVFCGSWSSPLLLCVPIGISLGAVIGPSLETFFVNYAAVIPLYWMGDFAMTEIGLRTGALVSNYIGISTR